MKTRFVRKGMIFFILVLLISVGFISGSYGFQPSNSQNQGVNAQLSDELLFDKSGYELKFKTIKGKSTDLKIVIKTKN